MITEISLEKPKLLARVHAPRRRGLAQPRWEGVVCRKTLELMLWPDWVPLLEPDELDPKDPLSSLGLWIEEVFTDKEARVLVQRLIKVTLFVYLLTYTETAQRCADAWNIAMAILGYRTEADDWR